MSNTLFFLAYLRVNIPLEPWFLRWNSFCILVLLAVFPLLDIWGKTCLFFCIRRLQKHETDCHTSWLRLTCLIWCLFFYISIFWFYISRDVHGDVSDRLTCSDCGKLFTSKRSLVGHKKEKHSGTLEIFPCQHCGKNFSRKSNLKAHMDSIHFGKKFPCAYCERIFTNRSCMNLHVKKTHLDLIGVWDKN